jgi:hypothetical protein
MDNSHQKQISQEVTGFYQTYVFPQIEGFSRNPDSYFWTNRFNYMLNRRQGDALPPEMEIWVRGCGTALTKIGPPL